MQRSILEGKRVKRLTAVILCVTVILSASGCFAFVRHGDRGGGAASPSFGDGKITLPADRAAFVLCEENSTPTSISLKYGKFNGTASRVFDLTEDQLDIKVSVTTEKGSFDLSILDSRGNSCYTGTDMKTCDFTVTVKEAGEYAVIAKGDKHKGGFEVSWG
jgi:hypothetical protein